MGEQVYEIMLENGLVLDVHRKDWERWPEAMRRIRNVAPPRPSPGRQSEAERLASQIIEDVTPDYDGGEPPELKLAHAVIALQAQVEQLQAQIARTRQFEAAHYRTASKALQREAALREALRDIENPRTDAGMLRWLASRALSEQSESE